MEKEHDELRAAREKMRDTEREQIREIIEKKDAGFSTWKHTFEAGKNWIARWMFYGFCASALYSLLSTANYQKDEIDGKYRLIARKRRVAQKSRELYDNLKLDLSSLVLDHSEGNLAAVSDSFLHSVEIY